MYLPTDYSMKYYPAYVSKLANNILNKNLLKFTFHFQFTVVRLDHPLEKMNGLLKQYQIYVIDIVNEWFVKTVSNMS